MSFEALVWYGSIFLWLFFTGIGIPPFPEEAGILYAAGVTALHENVHWWLAWPSTGAGIVCADMVLYATGRLWGPRLFQYRWVNRVMPPERRGRIEARFHEHGIKILLLARLLPPLRTGIFLIAGAIRFSFVQFLLADVAYAIVGVGILFFGGTWLVALISRAGHWIAFVAAGAVMIYALFRYYRVLRQHETRRIPQPPISILEVPVGGGASEG